MTARAIQPGLRNHGGSMGDTGIRPAEPQGGETFRPRPRLEMPSDVLSPGHAKSSHRMRSTSAFASPLTGVSVGRTPSVRRW